MARRGCRVLRAAAESGVAAVHVFGVFGVFGLLSPGGTVAERNYGAAAAPERFDVGCFQELSADAVPTLERLPEPPRS
ncbi:DUF4173 domain-containing protein [Streptomyces sp. NBC_01142]|uniref:hypothetical protein n=1 Tax=Streptomyces sp. NBC_01142 TaxID=2975865 RepID=UPI002255DE83|nr:hypothetical protein [Streptomyces sp. NBC_01142]MCX4819827.1 DUF4173 domain-containing protein [Streptomyces sp. NBC_01142]